MRHFLLNDTEISTDLPPSRILLDFLRDEQRLTAAKSACREGDCGACLVLLGTFDGEGMRYLSVNSCLLPLGEAAGRHIVTLEGLNRSELSPIQSALVEEGGVQCGYCTAGIVVAWTDYLLEATNPDYRTAEEAMAGNLCRCTGYAGIRRAIIRICNELEFRPKSAAQRVERLIGLKILPAYFRTIPERLHQLPIPQTGLATDQAVKLGGGTDWLVQKHDQSGERRLVFLSRQGPLRGIWLEQGRCFIAAETTEEEIRSSPLLNEHFPGSDEDFRLIASSPVRHRATLGGNLANASPVADLAVYFLAHNATLGIKQGRNLREIPLSGFFLGYKRVDLRDDEEIERLSFELPSKPTLFSFEKTSRRTYLDVAAVNSALRIEMVDGLLESAWLSAGGVAPVPLFLGKASDFLAGRRLDAAEVTAAARLAQNAERIPW